MVVSLIVVFSLVHFPFLYIVVYFKNIAAFYHKLLNYYVEDCCKKLYYFLGLLSITKVAKNGLHFYLI